MNTDDLYRLLRTSHAQAQGVVDTLSDPVLVLDSGLCVQAASLSFYETFGVDRYETIGQGLFELGNGQWDIPELRGLLKQVLPKTTAIINYEVEHDFPTLGRRFMLLTARTLHQSGGGRHSILLTIVDATERHQRDEAKDLLFGELRHRMKNILGVARSVARQTTTEGRSAEEYRDAFLGRFEALIQAEDLAFDEQSPAGIREILERTLAPYLATPGAVIIEGEAVADLGPRRTLSLGLLFHELATNAAKHGALSAPGGNVTVFWALENDGHDLRVSWRESGGPPVAAPATKGFGSELIQSTISYTLGGAVEQDFALQGYSVEVVIPLRNAAPTE
jgi:two-component sensor histidine kinase